MSKCVQFKATGMSSDQKATKDETSLSGEARTLKDTQIINVSPGINEIGSASVTRKNAFKACPTYSMPNTSWRSNHSNESNDKGFPDETKASKDTSMIPCRDINCSPDHDLSPKQIDKHERGEDRKERGGVQLLAKSVSISVNGAVQSDENEKEVSSCIYTMDRKVSFGLSVAEADLAKINHVSKQC